MMQHFGGRKRTPAGGVSVCVAGGGAECVPYKTRQRPGTNILFSFSRRARRKKTPSVFWSNCFSAFSRLFETWRTLFLGANLVETNMSHVDVKNLKPSSFEEEYYDQYEYYNLTDKYAGERIFLFYSHRHSPVKKSWSVINTELVVNRRLSP